MLVNHAKRVSEILPEILQPSGPARVPAFLLHLFRPAERQPRSPPCFPRLDSTRNQLARVLLQMKAHFLVELLFHLFAPQQSLPPVHSPPPSESFRMREIGR